jgi:hypothetical protein
MLLLAKVALGIGATLALSAAYVFHEGVIKVDMDQTRSGGSHVHVWVPATTVSMGLRLTPRHYLRQASEPARPYLPAIREVAKELEKYPNMEIMDAECADDHYVRIATRGGRLYIDAVTNTNTVHVSFPAATLRDVADRLEDAAPGI